jgi:serine/threonine protein kinase
MDLANATQTDIIGTTIDGKFRILNTLGEGSFGTVYRAEQTDLSRIVALKLLNRSTLSGSTAQARFEREATLLAALQDKNIVQIYGFGMADGQHPYLYMEYLQGKTLETLFSKRRPFSWQKTAAVGLQICKALSAAHKKGIVHRDLTPRNIMFINEDGRDLIKILDFGLSSVMLESDIPLQRITQTGEVVGTVVYMSPEVARGMRADARSDIYSLGCILYECVTGHPACDGDDVLEVMSKQQLDLPEAFFKPGNSQGMPKEFELAIFKALQKPPEHRYQSAEEFSAALSMLAEGRASEIDLPGVQVGGQQSILRKQQLPIALGAVLLLMVGIAASWSYLQSSYTTGKIQQTSQSPKQLDPVEQERASLRQKFATYDPSRLDEYVWQRLNDDAEPILEGPHPERAVPILKGVAAELEAHLGPQTPPRMIHAMLTAKDRLADRMLQSGRFQECQQIATSILEYVDTHDIKETPTVGISRFNALYYMAVAGEDTHTPDQGLSWGLRAWDYAQKAPQQVRDQKYAQAAWWLGEHYLNTGDRQKGIDFLKLAINAADVVNMDTVDPWFHNRAQIVLARTYLQMAGTAETPAKRNQLSSMAEKLLDSIGGKNSNFDFKRLDTMEVPLTMAALYLNKVFAASGENHEAAKMLNSVLQFQKRTSLLRNHEEIEQELSKIR